MFKFLRKYNKLILVVGGSLLMVAFLAPQAIQQIGQGAANSPIYEIEGTVYRGKDVNAGIVELQYIRQISQGARVELLAQVGLTQEDPTAHWLMLTKLAEDSGLYAGPEDGRLLFDDLANEGLAAFAAGPMPPAQLQNLRQQIVGPLEQARGRVIATGRPARAVDDSLAKYRAVRRLRQTYLNLSSISPAEAAYHGREQFERVIADVAVVAAGAYLDRIEELSEDDLLAHFDAFKNVDRTVDPRGIGYLREPRARLETLFVDREAIEDAYPIDDIEVRKLFTRDSDRYGDDFAEARASVERTWKARQVNELLDEVDLAILRTLAPSRRGLDGDSDGYRRLPADWADRRPAFEQLAEAANAVIDRVVTMPDPAVTLERMDESTSVFNLPELRADSATATAGERSVPFMFAIQSTRELGMDIQAARFLPGVQEGLTVGPLRDPRGNLAYFRVLDARPASPPDSLDDVRDIATANARGLRAAEVLYADAPNLERAVVESNGVGVLLDRFADNIRTGIGVQINRNVAVDAGGRPFAPLEGAADFRRAITGLTAGWDPLVPVDERPLTDRVVATPIEDRGVLAVGVITGWRPLTLEQLRRFDTQIVSAALRETLRSEDRPDANIDPFSYERLAERMELRVLDIEMLEERQAEAAAEAELDADEQPADDAEPS